MDVMVDIETMGNGSDAAIIAIGAWEFNVETKSLGRCFYRIVDLQSSVDAGMKMDASTVMWWLKQSEGARAAISKPGESLTTVLKVFADWFPKGATLWGNGATFDNVILASAYRLTKQERPWKYSADRCYRTLKNLHPGDQQETVGIAHNALDDAKSQALHALKLLSK